VRQVPGDALGPVKCPAPPHQAGSQGGCFQP
jgi:hypothetical protein